jgi:RNA polymerase sigma factor (sigma-70 family)
MAPWRCRHGASSSVKPPGYASRTGVCGKGVTASGALARSGGRHVHETGLWETLVGVTEATLTVTGAVATDRRELFAGLVEAHWDRLVGLARSVVGDLEAEDAAQEGLIAAWQSLAQLRDVSRFGPWVTRIVFRRCLRRTRSLRRRVPLESAPVAAHSPDPADRIAVWQVLARLAPRQRAVLHLTVVEGMNDREIADALGIAAASVRAHRRRARAGVERLVKVAGS